MNYRHIYHAGNFADIVKHITLISILRSYQKDQKNFEVVDGFAGIGLYNLDSIEASKTREYNTGISRFLSCKGQMPNLLEEYKRIVSKFIYAQKSIFPGSPFLISEFLGKNDKAEFCELNKHDFKVLQSNMEKMPGCNVHNQDAYSFCESFCAGVIRSQEKRRLIFLDPPFEKPDEFEKLAKICEHICKDITGQSESSILIWYPIKDYMKIRDFHSRIASLGKDYIRVSFAINPEEDRGSDSSSDGPSGGSSGSSSDRSSDRPRGAGEKEITLRSTGLIIINPPSIEEELKDAMFFLRDAIYKGAAQCSVIAKRSA